MPDETRIAMVGAGRMAEAHLQAFLAHAGVVCTGIYSRTPQRAMALAHRYGCPPVYTSLADRDAPHGTEAMQAQGVRWHESPFYRRYTSSS
jgi:glutamyl-tRNA reductase